MEFTAHLDKFNSNLWGYHISVPEVVAKSFLDEGQKRVVCRLNDQVEFQCALMPRGDGSWFINLNKKIRDTLGLKLGESVQVSLSKDESTYGLPMPEEFEAVLQSDEEGNQLFHALTPGKQRTMLYFVGNHKKSDTRIARALLVVEHLKANGGKIDFKRLYEEVKGI